MIMLVTAVVEADLACFIFILISIVHSIIQRPRNYIAISFFIAIDVILYFNMVAIYMAGHY